MAHSTYVSFLPSLDPLVLDQSALGDTLQFFFFKNMTLLQQLATLNTLELGV